MTGQNSFWFANPSTGFYTQTIDQSLRFEDGDSPYLLRTPSSAGNHKSLTISMWVRRGNLGSNHVLMNVFVSASPNNQGVLRFNSSDKLQFTNFSGEYDIVTNRVFRDTTNWYHILIRVDTTQSTASERIKIYVNGTLETSLATSTYPTQNLDLEWNTTNKHLIGARTDNSTPTPIQEFDGYLAEVNLVDGQALGPESFGELKNETWIPKSLSSVSYGTNGFRLTFADSSSLGDDTSGNGNDYSSSGLASTDVVLDSPTNTFATLNVLDKNSGLTLKEGNLEVTTSAGFDMLRSTFFVGSGKWYWEVRSTDGGNGFIGVSTASESLSSRGAETNQSAMLVTSDGDIRTNATESSYGNSVADGDIIGIALDMDNGKIYFSENGTYYNSGNPANGTNPAVTGLTTEVSPSLSVYDNEDFNVNFGADSTFAGAETAQGNTDDNGIGDFYYSPPSGYLALCTSNLSDTTLSPDQDEQAGDYFNTVLYTGNGSSGHAITGVGFQPDWVWIKERNGVTNHGLHDSSRVSSGNEAILFSNDTDAESTGGAYLSSFDSDGFTVNNNTSGNNSSDTYVAWNWKANGGTTSSNTNGDITSTVQVSNTAGFSLILYTGFGEAVKTVGHGLSQAPEMIFFKTRGSGNWFVYHKDTGNTGYMFLNNQNAFTSDSNFLNNTTPSSSLITLGSSSAANAESTNFVAYAFHSVEGYSKIGTYTGNGSTDGPFIFTGFRPAWLMVKRTTASGHWLVFDNKRLGYNPDLVEIQAGTTAAELEFDRADLVSNGFKHRTDFTDNNGSGSTYIYMAFAEQPFKFSNAR